MRSTRLLLLLTAMASTVACTRKMTEADCDHLFGHALGLSAYRGEKEPFAEMGVYGGVPISIEQVRKDATGSAKDAIDGFYHVCIGGSDDGSAVACSRRATKTEELQACGGLVRASVHAANEGKRAMLRKYDVHQCAAYAEHAVRISAITADDVAALVRSCEGWVRLGLFECRNAATTSAAWQACKDDGG